jgi:hypothetical protein
VSDGEGENKKRVGRRRWEKEEKGYGERQKFTNNFLNSFHSGRSK